MHMAAIREALGSVPLTNPHERAYFQLHQWRYEDTLTLIPPSRFSGAEIVDVGSLPCHLPVALFSLGARSAIGLDHAPDRFKGQKELEGRGMDLRVCDVSTETFPLPDAAADIVLCNEVIEHFDQGAEHCLAECRRVLRPDGLLILTTPNRNNLANRLRRLFGRPEYVPEKGLAGKQLHHHEYSMEELCRVVQVAGFQVSASRYLAGSEKALLRGAFPTRLPRPFAWLYACVPLAIPPLRSYLAVVARPADTPVNRG
jgi:SAM-dependent methyltransferase